MDDILEFNLEYELSKIIDDEFLTEVRILPMSKTPTKSFKRFYLEHLICEMPDRETRLYGALLEDRVFNGEEACDYVEGKKGKLAGDFFDRTKIHIYYDTELDKAGKEIIKYILIPENIKYIIGCVKLLIIKDKSNIEYFSTRGLWKDQTFGKEIIFNFVIKWLLPKYKVIISDNTTSLLGERFWKKIAEYALANNKECGIYIDSILVSDKEKQFQRLLKIKAFEMAWNQQGIHKRIYIKE